MDPAALISLFKVLRGVNSVVEAHQKAEEIALAKASGTYIPPASPVKNEWGVRIFWVPVICFTVYLSMRSDFFWSWKIILGVMGFITYPLCFFFFSLQK